MSNTLLSTEVIARRIFLIRGQKVMLDADLAELYNVETRALVQAVKRNQIRFPSDFSWQLSDDEWATLRSQIVTSNGRGGRRYAPYVFTEHGALMLSSVLSSSVAAEIGLLIVRTFVQLRQLLATHKDLSAKLDELERKVSSHDQAISGLIDAIRQLMAAPGEASRPIGFTANIANRKSKP